MKQIIINENEEKFILLNESTKIIANKNSKVSILSFDHDLEVINFLNGENSEVNCFNIFYGINEDEIKINVKAIHNNKNTKSNLVCRGILDNKSKLNYSGVIRMEKNSKNSDGYQKQDTLLLSKDASANSIPQLEILENEVKCSHGVTLTDVNEEQLFYLKSRGLTEKQAKREIVKGFLDPIINKIENLNLQNEVRIKLGEKIRI